MPSKYTHDYYLKHKKRVMRANKIWASENRESINKRQRAYRLREPWRYLSYQIKDRCKNPDSNRNKYYGGRGIKCLLTAPQIKKLWFRDKAYLMKKPSIDRENPDGNYEYDNCQFMEFGENSAKGNRERKRYKNK